MLLPLSLFWDSQIRTKSRMGRRVRVEVINTDYLVIRTRGQIFAISRESHRVNGSRVMAHGRELLGFRVFGISGVGNGLG